MPEHYAPAIACGLAFLLGSIPFGLLVARAAQGGADREARKDIRVEGSGNIGATNVSRVLGFWPWGALTFGLDLAKGSAAVLWAMSAGELSTVWVWAVALACVLGHCYSPWLRFRGGKGVATGFGVVLVLAPIAALAGIVAFGIAFVATRTGSVSSLCGLLTAAACELVIKPVEAHLALGALLMLVILVRHESNLDALLEKNEKIF